MGGQPLDPQKEYVVATNDYLVAGGDGYTAFGEALKSAGDYTNLGGTLTSSKLVYNDPGTWLRDLVIAAHPGPENHRPQNRRPHQSSGLTCGYMLTRNPWIWSRGCR